MDIVKYAHLIARLAYEDDFRQRFIADPKATLTEIGIVDLEDKDCPPPELLASRLASKETLQKEYEDRLLRIAIQRNTPAYSLLI